jgi:hypothetical protein
MKIKVIALRDFISPVNGNVRAGAVLLLPELRAMNWAEAGLVRIEGAPVPEIKPQTHALETKPEPVEEIETKPEPIEEVEVKRRRGRPRKTPE